MNISTDALEMRLIELEAAIAAGRLEQAELIAEADRRQLATADGCRSLNEWVASRLDVSPETASALTRVARTTCAELADGAHSFDRISEWCRLFVSPQRSIGGSPPEAGGGHSLTLHDTLAFDIAGLRRHVASCRRLTSQDESVVFDGRYLAIQPSLDESRFRLWGQRAGVDGKLVEQALDARADEFPRDVPSSLGQRRADALVSLAQSTSTGSASVPLVSVFVDADRFTGAGETGVSVEAGPRVGPNTLAELVCTGSVEVNATSQGRLLAVGKRSRVVSGRLRRHVLHRDGGCVADACRSRYRLQAHHIVPWSEGGATTPENLATLCWYHHHVVVHGMGYRIDPKTPPNRRRFLPP